MQHWKLAGWGLLCASLALPAVASHVTEPNTLRVGMASALSGPAAGLGWQLRAGATAYFDKVNAAGGVHGKRLELVSVDDGYDPGRSVTATRELLDKYKVFTLFGFVGTPTSAAVIPIAAKEGVPYLFPFTGAEFLRAPLKPVVYNLRASYYDETEALVARLLRQNDRKIALFIQDDEFGEAGKAGVVRALQKRQMAPVVEARFTRNTIEVDDGFIKLARAKPDAVIFIGTYRPLAALVKKARAAGMPTRFATVSFIGTSEFIKHAGAAGEGVLVSQVMPAPDDASEPLVRQYHADVPPAARNYGSLEGYADAVVLVEALRRCGANCTRAGLMAALDQLDMRLGSIPVRFSPRQHQGMDRVYLTEIRAGRAVQLPRD
jgi:ABC-type branched-subunit amino acid transport system substrate-binding protein